MPGCLSKCNPRRPLTPWMNSSSFAPWTTLLPTSSAPQAVSFPPLSSCCFLLTLQMAGLILWCCCIFQGQVLTKSLGGFKCQGSPLVTWEISFKIMGNGEAAWLSGVEWREGGLWRSSLEKWPSLFFQTEGWDDSCLSPLGDGQVLKQSCGHGLKGPFFPLVLVFSLEIRWTV